MDAELYNEEPGTKASGLLDRFSDADLYNRYVLKRKVKDPYEQELGPGRGIVGRFDNWLTDNVVEPAAKAGWPNAGAGVAAGASAIADFAIPQTAGDFQPSAVFIKGPKKVLTDAEKLSKYLPLFGRPRDLSMKRQEALQAVRQSLNVGGLFDDGGSSALVREMGDKVVKSPADSIYERPSNLREFKRRGFLKSILSANGISPETMLVETRGNKYLVQPKADMMEMADYHFMRPEERLWRELSNAGVTGKDLSYRNIGIINGRPQLIDAGLEKLERAMTPAERTSALEKFISYGKRKKPWLDE